MRPPRLRCTLFPLIYPPHLLVLPATFGLHLLLQTYPYFRALYVISVRRTKSLLTASFRFHLAMDTLAVQLYTSSLPRRVRDLHPLERAHGAQTQKKKCLCHYTNISLFHPSFIFPESCSPRSLYDFFMKSESPVKTSCLLPSFPVLLKVCGSYPYNDPTIPCRFLLFSCSCMLPAVLYVSDIVV